MSDEPQRYTSGRPRQFFYDIHDTSVTIRNVYLQELKEDCAAKDQSANEGEMARICQTKKKPENRVRAEAFHDSEKCFKEPGRYKLRSRANRRERGVDYEN